MIILGLLALAPVPAVATPYSDLMDCMRRAAVRLERSGEGPAAIAGAARLLCNPQMIAAFNDPRAPKDAAAIDSDAREVAANAVVYVRLCARAKDCDLAP